MRADTVHTTMPPRMSVKVLCVCAIVANTGEAAQMPMMKED